MKNFYLTLRSLVLKKPGSKTSTNITKSSVPITPFQPGMRYHMPILVALHLVFPARPQLTPPVAAVAVLATPVAVVSPAVVAAVAAVAAGKNQSPMAAAVAEKILPRTQSILY